MMSQPKVTLTMTNIMGDGGSWEEDPLQ